jgi:predicted PhzF superfamily epimerase YddE/YHI9
VGIQEDRASGSAIPALVAYWGRDGAGSHIFSQESGHDIRIRARQFGDRIGVSGEVLRFASGKLGCRR